MGRRSEPILLRHSSAVAGNQFKLFFSNSSKKSSWWFLQNNSESGSPWHTKATRGWESWRQGCPKIYSVSEHDQNENLQTSYGWIYVTCLVTWPLTCMERVPCWCHKHNLPVGTSQSSICKRPKSNQLRNGFANCPEMTLDLVVMDPSDAVEVWDCPYFLISESVRMGHENGSHKYTCLCPELRECHKGHEKGSHKYTCLCPDFRECQDGTWKGFL